MECKVFNPFQLIQQSVHDTPDKQKRRYVY